MQRKRGNTCVNSFLVVIDAEDLRHNADRGNHCQHTDWVGQGVTNHRHIVRSGQLALIRNEARKSIDDCCHSRGVGQGACEGACAFHRIDRQKLDQQERLDGDNGQYTNAEQVVLDTARA